MSEQFSSLQGFVVFSAVDMVILLSKVALVNNDILLPFQYYSCVNMIKYIVIK